MKTDLQRTIEELHEGLKEAAVNEIFNSLKQNGIPADIELAEKIHEEVIKRLTNIALYGDPDGQKD